MFFHSAATLLRPGSIIEPGRFGRYVSRLQPHDKVFLQECIYEELRERHAPAAVSRLNCVFACASMDDLNAFMGTARALNYERYEVRPLDGAAIDVRDLHFIDEAVRHIQSVQNVNLGVLTPLAMSYWTPVTNPNARTELLIGGAVEVIRRLDA